MVNKLGILLFFLHNSRRNYVYSISCNYSCETVRFIFISFVICSFYDPSLSFKRQKLFINGHKTQYYTPSDAFTIFFSLVSRRILDDTARKRNGRCGVFVLPTNKNSTIFELDDIFESKYFESVGAPIHNGPLNLTSRICWY